jgi:hypothetical protein
MAPVGYRLPNTIFRYVLAVSWRHQIALVALTVITFLLEVVPLEIQRRAVNDLVKERSFSLVVLLCAVYAGVVLVQGSTKLAECVVWVTRSHCGANSNGSFGSTPAGSWRPRERPLSALPCH